MSCYIVVFEVSAAETATKVETVLKEYGFYCPITEHSWAVVTDDKPTQIRDKIAAVVKPEDRIFVVRSGTAAAWRSSFGPKHDQWLKENL